MSEQDPQREPHRQGEPRRLERCGSLHDLLLRLLGSQHAGGRAQTDHWSAAAALPGRVQASLQPGPLLGVSPALCTVVPGPSANGAAILAGSFNFIFIWFKQSLFTFM